MLKETNCPKLDNFLLPTPLLENESSLAFSEEDEKGLLWVCCEAGGQRGEPVGIESPPVRVSAFRKCLSCPWLTYWVSRRHCFLILEIGLSITYICQDVRENGMKWRVWKCSAKCKDCSDASHGFMLVMNVSPPGTSPAMSRAYWQGLCLVISCASFHRPVAGDWTRQAHPGCGRGGRSVLLLPLS